MYKLNNFNGLIKELILPSYMVKPFWGQLAMAAYSAYEGNKAKKKSGQAEGMSDAARAKKIAQAQKSYDAYKTTFGPNDQKLITSLDEFDARNTLQKYKGQAAADVAGAYEKQQAMSGRQMARYGVDPGDERFQQQQRAVDLERTKAEIQGSSEAEDKYQAEQDKQFARRLAAGKHGKTASAQDVNLQNAYGGEAAAMSSQAAGYAKQAGEGYTAAGKLAGKAIDSWGDSGSGDNIWRTQETPDYGSGEMTDEFGTFSSGDTGW